jgi:hypothetical protein
MLPHRQRRLSRSQKKTKAKPAATRAAPSPEVLSKRTTATILAQIHQGNLKEIAISKLAQEKGLEQRGSSLRRSVDPGSTASPEHSLLENIASG